MATWYGDATHSITQAEIFVNNDVKFYNKLSYHSAE